MHGRDAQKRPLPEHNGRHVNFRRMIPFEACTEPLTEGVTPKGQELRQAGFTVMVKPYGRHVEVTDELNFFQLDNLHRETAQLLSDQAALSLDTLCRDAITAGLNVQYAGGKSSRSAITSADKLTAADVKEAVRTLKRNHCKPFPDGFYHAVIHPDAVYDLTADSAWVDVATYQDKGKLERYELGCLYKVKFFESPNAKVFEAEPYLYDEVASLTVTGVDVPGRRLKVSAPLDEDAARKLTGRMAAVRCGGKDMPVCIERVQGDTVQLRWMPQEASGWSGSMTLVPGGAGEGGAPVYATVIYGQNAYGTVELGGRGKNVKIIINPPGSAGADDPLEQRGTIAWKVKGFCCSILQDAFLVRLEHGASV